MKILLTNDDSHRSPLLACILEILKGFAEVSLVVPHHEQSWTGKALTRFSSLHAHEIELFGHSGFAVSGTPADCVNLGIHNLIESKPDLIVSGINAGYNTGLGFLLSSGTVGACFEGNIAGIPAIAFSQAFDSETRNQYAADYHIAETRMASFRKVYENFIPKFVNWVHALPKEQGAFPVTWNVNFPVELRPTDNIRQCRLGHTRYGKSFEEKGVFSPNGLRAFSHELTQIIRDSDSECDSELVAKGVIALTPLDLKVLGQSKVSDFTL